MKVHLVFLFTALCVVLGVMIACSGDDDDDNDDSDDAADDATTDDDAASCTIEEKCQFEMDCAVIEWPSVDECVSESESYLAGCADADSMMDCICACVAGTCEDYPACGESCYSQFCS